MNAPVLSKKINQKTLIQPPSVSIQSGIKRLFFFPFLHCKISTNCHELKEGTYLICIQFFTIDKIPISLEVCKDFRVEATNVE
jgi:hypothetical protein